MATSSIFASFDINDPQKAAAFVNALDKSYRDSLKHPVKHKPLDDILSTDSDKIKKLAKKWNTK